MNPHPAQPSDLAARDSAIADRRTKFRAGPVLLMRWSKLFAVGKASAERNLAATRRN